MKRAYHIIAGMLATAGIIFVCFIVLVVADSIWKIPIHQLNLWKLAGNFQEIKHPSDSKLLSKVKGFGNLFRDASNGCDYLVGEFRVGRNSRDEIVRRYQELSINSFDRKERVLIEVHFLDDEKFFEDSLWFDWREKIRTSFNSKTAQGNLYTVFARQTGYSPYGDIRCFYESPIY